MDAVLGGGAGFLKQLPELGLIATGSGFVKMLASGAEEKGLRREDDWGLWQQMIWSLLRGTSSELTCQSQGFP